MLFVLFQIHTYTMAVAGLVAGGVTVFIVPILLCICGFTMCGVRILSCAACWQSSVGNVESGSCFSCLQSVAANWCQVKSIGVFLLLGLVVGVTTGMVLLVKTDVKYFDMDHAIFLFSGYFPALSLALLLFASIFSN